MHDAANSVKLAIIKKIIKMIRNKVLWWKIVGGLNIAGKIVINVLSLLICLTCGSNDIGKVLYGLEGSCNCNRLVRRRR
jgi:hypothetical protein